MELLILLIPLAIGIAVFAFWLMMLIHCLRGESPNKILWFLAIVLLNFLGAVLYRIIEYPRVKVAPSGLPQGA